MVWLACKNGDCSRFERPTANKACSVCGERTDLYQAPAEPALAAHPLARDNEDARRVAERRQQWSAATGVPLAASTPVPYALNPAARAHERRASAWNYLWIALGLVGGIVGNLLLRDEDPPMAKRILVWGLVLTVASSALLLFL